MEIQTLYGYTSMRPEQSAHLIVDGGSHELSFREIALVALVGAMAFWIATSAIEYQRKPTFELRNDDWHCTAQHTSTTTTFVNMGDGKTITLIPITTTNTTCDQWTHN